MEYQVISRKYRPQRFDEIIGQPHICTTLQNSIKSERVSHSFLFTGSRGIGKTSTARILAKTLNCLNTKDINPCNECQNCKEITSGRSIDVLEIDGASNRGIDQIRELRENVKYPPASSQYRIFIIDEVHMLTKEAFNALLKTLEEPPPHVIFIFATTEPQKIPPTILSRCQRYDFHRIPLNMIIEHLRFIAGAEKVAIPEDILLLIAKKSDGSMRDAESILDQVISFADKDLQIRDVQKILGLIDYEYFFRVAALIQHSEKGELIDVAKQIFNEGIDIGEFISGFLEHFRNLLIVKSTQASAILDLPANAKKEYENNAENWELGDILRYTKILTDAQVTLKNAANPRMHLEFTLLKMAVMDKTVTVQDLIENLQKQPARTASQPISRRPLDLFSKSEKPQTGEPAAQKKSAANSPQPKTDAQKKTKIQNESNEITIGNIRKEWGRLIHEIGDSDPSVASFLRNSMPHRIRQNVLEISFHETAKFHRNGTKKRSSVVEKALKGIFHKDLRVECILSNEGSIAMPDTKELDEITRTIVDAFDGEILI